MWTVTDDGSVIAEDGKVMFFSTSRFITDICLGDCCFICGVGPQERQFNNEHVLPEWLLRRYDLFERTIILPNESEIRYDRYTVPCCTECNALMGEVVEQPISEVVQAGIDGINDFISNGSGLKMFVWMGLIYLKTHLKDRTLRYHRDARKGDAKIADEYEWEYLHHIHSVVRCFYTGCVVEPEVIGSFLSIPVNPQVASEKFDYGDLYLAQTMLLRLGDLALLAVLNDSGGAMSYFWQKLQRITGPVSELQLREIMIELAYLNLHLKERPTFLTGCDAKRKTCRIVGKRPGLELMEMDRRARGAMLRHAVRHALPSIRVAGKTDEEVEAAISAGTFTFLFDDNGQFIGEPWRQIGEED